MASISLVMMLLKELLTSVLDCTHRLYKLAYIIINCLAPMSFVVAVLRKEQSINLENAPLMAQLSHYSSQHCLGRNLNQIINDSFI